MANIRSPRKNKDGSYSFSIRVFLEEIPGQKQRSVSTTWRSKPNTTLEAATKKVEKYAILFEEDVRKGRTPVGDNIQLGELCQNYIDFEPLEEKTKEVYQYLMPRINAAIGHIKVGKLKANHLEEFYQNLKEPGITRHGNKASPLPALQGAYKKSKLSQTQLADKAGVARETLKRALDGKDIGDKVAKKIAAALGQPLDKLFAITPSTLSEESIYKYHRFIVAVLNRAKRKQIVNINVAAEYATPPKTPRHRADYLDDIEARDFLACVLEEEDIRVKTVLIVFLFTGLRRGELCGLKLNDIQFQHNKIRVNKARQYTKASGVHEVKTKTFTSDRLITVPDFVMKALKQYTKWYTEQRILHGPIWQGQEEYLFINYNGSPIYPDTINSWLVKACERYGFRRITPTNLRHTFATLQITSNVDIKTLQGRTGHARASTLLNTYSHIIEHKQTEASEALEKLLVQ